MRSTPLAGTAIRGTIAAVISMASGSSLRIPIEEVARILRVRDLGGAPCREVRELAGEKLVILEERLAEMRDACGRLRAVLSRWDALLSKTPNGNRAGLLEALEGLVEAGRPSPFLPPPLRRSRRP